MTEPSRELLHALRTRRDAERDQAALYRALAAAAENAGDAALADRLQELHADEQHHLSRLTARLLELGAEGAGETRGHADLPALAEWEGHARAREADEVRAYEALLADVVLDAATVPLIREILDTERHHMQELGGKWTPA